MKKMIEEESVLMSTLFLLYHQDLLLVIISSGPSNKLHQLKYAKSDTGFWKEGILGLIRVMIITQMPWIHMHV